MVYIVAALFMFVKHYTEHLNKFTASNNYSRKKKSDMIKEMKMFRFSKLE